MDEKVVKQDAVKHKAVLVNSLVVTGLIFATLFSVVVVTYGLDTVIAGAHDTFHDFRHSIGMACH